MAKAMNPAVRMVTVRLAARLLEEVAEFGYRLSAFLR